MTDLADAIAAEPDLTDTLARWLELQRVRGQQAHVSRSQLIMPTDFPSPGALAKTLDSTTIETPALRIIDDALVRVQKHMDGEPGGIDRLIVSMPPQEGKSERVTHFGAEWFLQRNPNLRLGLTSYGDEMVKRHSYAIRNDIVTNNGEEGNIDLGMRLRRDTKAAGRWNLNYPHRGGVYAVSIGGAFTGRPIDCLIGETRIRTTNGYDSIRDLYQSTDRPQVLTWNHTTERTEWRQITAARSIERRRVVEVSTTSGRRFACTGDHSVWTERGYIPASRLRHGDRLIASDADADMRPMPATVSSDASRGCEETAKRTEGSVLWSRLRRRLLAIAWTSVPALRQTNGVRRSPPPLLFANVSGCIGTTKEEQGVPSLRGDLPVLKCQTDLLHSRVRQPGSLATDDRLGKLSLQGRDQLRSVVSQDAPTDQRTRRWSLSSVRAIKSVGHPSHRRSAVAQRATEPDHTLSDLSFGAPQVSCDTVSVVRSIRDRLHTVYDLQVEGNYNFFAEDVLVHNCLIIDDPVKDARAAESVWQSVAAWDWWTAVARPRLAPGAPVVLVLTRWHELDLAGRMLRKQAEDEASDLTNFDRWHVINIPAKADYDPNAGEYDILGRAIGEYMESARGRTRAQWETTEAATPIPTWQALYQGRPNPKRGDVWREPWWGRYDTQLWQHDLVNATYRVIGSFDLIWQSWDMAFKDTKTADFVVGQVWMKQGADTYLLDQVCKRLTFTETIRAMRHLTHKWEQASAKLVEDKANGTAVIDSLKREIAGLIPINPTDSKQGRAIAVSPFIRAGNVHLPTADVALFDVEAFLSETNAFPNGAHDDQVDAASQALMHVYIDGHGISQVAVPQGRIPSATARQGDSIPAHMQRVMRQQSGRIK